MVAELRWQFQLQDETVVGWLVTVSYFVAALACLLCARAEKQAAAAAGQQRAAGWAWWMVVLILVLLGINKEFDFHSLFVQLAGEAVTELGWSEYKSIIRIVGVSGVLLSFVTVGVLFRRQFLSVRFRWILICLLCLFAVLLLPYLPANRGAAFMENTINVERSEIWHTSLTELCELVLVWAMGMIALRLTRRRGVGGVPE